MKLELLTHATVMDDAVRFVSEKQQQQTADLFLRIGSTQTICQNLDNPKPKNRSKSIESNVFASDTVLVNVLFHSCIQRLYLQILHFVITMYKDIDREALPDSRKPSTIRV